MNPTASTAPRHLSLSTLVELQERSFERFSNDPLFGVLRGEQWHWTTYGEFRELVDRCRTGLDDINSALCVAALAQVTRGATGNLTSVFTPDINVSRESEHALTAAFQYGANAGELGDLTFGAEYTTILSHKQQTYAGDPYINLLNNPYYSTDPKSKTQVTLGWSKDKYKAALYANWISSTPNYVASNSSSGDYSAPGAGKLPPHTIFNASASMEVIEGLELSVMVNNLFNTMPPVDPYYPANSGAPYNSYNFNPYGREVMFELHYAFGKKK